MTYSFTQATVSHDHPDDGILEVAAEDFARSLEERVGGVLLDASFVDHIICRDSVQ